MYLPTIHTKVRISRHAATRMKERAGLNTKPRREKFVRKAAKSALSLSMIPQSVFPEFYSYMKNIITNCRKKSEDECTVLLYMNYFLIVSRYHGDIVTIINVDPKYKNYYSRITQYRNTPKTVAEVNKIENEAYTVLKNSNNISKARNVVISIITSHGIKLHNAVDRVRKMTESITGAVQAV